MKSRVKKNGSLHQRLMSDTESGLENSNISNFKKQMEFIDPSGSTLKTSQSLEREDLSHARTKQQNADEQNEPTLYDTFESTYLKDFLEEVKEYNINKGLLKATPAEVETLKTDLAEPIDHDVVLEASDTVIDPTEEYKILFDEIDENDVIEDTINEEDEDFEVEDIFSKTMHDTTEDNDALVVVETVSESNDTSNTLGSTELELQAFESKILEQTQTMQHQIIEQERFIDEISDVQVRQNRLLNVVIMMLIFAIIVVALLIVSTIYPQFFNF